MKNILTVLVCAFLSLIIVGGIYFFGGDNYILSSDSRVADAILDQEITSYETNANHYYHVYDAGRLVGIISNIDYLNGLINDYYKENYEEAFPNTYMTFGGDVYVVEEVAYYKTENIDDDIFAYLLENNGIGMMTNVIDFSTSEGTYATIYVSSMDIFNSARDTFLNNFISETERNALAQSTSLDEMTEVGTRSIGYRIEETITSHTGVAMVDDIMTSEDEVLEYLCYGDNEEREYYTVQEGDTLQGIGFYHNDMSPTQIMMLNPGIILSVDQILEPGMQINVTYFTSPINVIVTKENLVLEEVYADQAIVIQDENLFEGATEIVQEERSGSSYVLYEEMWINGVLYRGEAKSSYVITQPVQAIIRTGTTARPNVGTGNFRWPVDNAQITCLWGCYYGHQATDVVNRYNRYGYIYAADNGTVVTKAYDGISGNYIVIDHNNGFQTYYGHMMSPSDLEVGDTVMKGDIIGQIGTTGYVTGPHVHFEIRVDGVKVNPCIYMNCEAIL